jgi:glycosyltransferase involved in cell wall biosynthesis
MRRTYVTDRGIAPAKVVLVSNWIDEERFSRMPERREACSRYDVREDLFTFLYLGNIGHVAGVEFVIVAFHAARLSGAQLVIVGDGSAKQRCVALVRDLGAERVRFISSPEVENVPLLQSLGHVCLLPLRKGAGMSSIPSKLLAYMLSAKPVLATVDAQSDTARCIREADCGWVGEPEDVKWLSHLMTDVAGMPSPTLEAIGRRGREYGLGNFSKAAGVERLASTILEAQVAELRGRLSADPE